jgi:hypothetical protein
LENDDGEALEDTASSPLKPVAEEGSGSAEKPTAQRQLDMGGVGSELALVPPPPPQYVPPKDKKRQKKTVLEGRKDIGVLSSEAVSLGERRPQQ